MCPFEWRSKGVPAICDCLTRFYLPMVEHSRRPKYARTEERIGLLGEPAPQRSGRVSASPGLFGGALPHRTAAAHTPLKVGLAGLEPEDVLVDLYVGRVDASGELTVVQPVPMAVVGRAGDKYVAESTDTAWFSSVHGHDICRRLDGFRSRLSSPRPGYLPLLPTRSPLGCTTAFACSLDLDRSAVAITPSPRSTDRVAWRDFGGPNMVIVTTRAP
jgi:hypothetical protein